MYLQDECGHVKGMFAADIKGNMVPPLDLRAAAWCASGALVRAAGDLGMSTVIIDAATSRLRRYAIVSGYDGVMEWNDKASWPEIRGGFAYAIWEIEAQEVLA